MALVTFSDSDPLLVADLNSNFQDSAAARLAIQDGFNGLQSYSCSSTVGETNVSMWIKPRTHVHLGFLKFNHKVLTGNGSFQVSLECITNPYALGSADPLVLYSTGALFPGPLVSTSSLTNHILLPGFVYELTAELLGGAGTAIMHCNLEGAFLKGKN